MSKRRGPVQIEYRGFKLLRDSPHGRVLYYISVECNRGGYQHFHNYGSAETGRNSLKEAKALVDNYHDIGSADRMLRARDASCPSY